MTKGIVRRIDDLGRIVIPKELRRTLMINDNDPMEISVEDNKIVIKKFSSFANYKGALESMLKTVENDYILDYEQKVNIENILKSAIEAFE